LSDGRKPMLVSEFVFLSGLSML